jgi:hypothetical protein
MTGPDATVAVSGTVSPEAATQARPRRYRVHANGRPVGAKGLSGGGGLSGLRSPPGHFRMTR